jgi:hypothetical protein
MSGPATGDENVITFALVSLDSSGLPARINDGLYVFSGRLRLFDNGVFAEGLTRNSGVRSPTGFQEASGSREEATTGTWSTLGDGRIELRYADRVPFVFDTATTADGRLLARCSGFWWCGSARATAWMRN